jgi:lipopolysaccharide export system protein LptC
MGLSAGLRLRRLIDRITLYLPLGVLALLAMGSWWLVRSMPELWEAPAQQRVRKEPDYHLAHFSTQIFNAQGRRTSQVSGERAQHYPDTDELHIDGVQVWVVNDEGMEVQATARRGIASGDGERITLLGDVHVLRPARGAYPRLEMRGERLVALHSQEKLLSDRPVEIVRERDRFTADTLDFDTKTGLYQLGGRVHGLLQPRQ